jgi:hypothetical protein
MTTFRDLVTNYPRGMKWSFAVTLQGIPDVFTDGAGTWGTINGRTSQRAGTLVTRDFQFSFRSDPQNPLITGSGINLSLVDDGTDYLNTLFAPDYEGTGSYMAQALAATSGATTVYVEDASQITAGSAYAYAGLETFQVTSRDTVADTLTVVRARFDTVRRAFPFIGRGVKVTTSPRILAGRVVEVWAAPIDSLTGAVIISDAAPIWAGVLKQVSQMDERIELQIEPLDSILQTAWPAILPSGTLFQRLNVFQMYNDSWTIRLHMLAYGGVSITGSEYKDFLLGEYNSAGTFTTVTPAEGKYSLMYLVKLIQDTINNYFATTTDEPWYGAGQRPFKNRISLSVQPDGEGRIAIVGQLNPDTSDLSGTSGYMTGQIEFEQGWGIFKQIGRWSALDISSRSCYLSRMQNNHSYIQEGDKSIELYCDNANYPFILAFKDYYSATTQGYVRIQDSSDVEIIAFTGVTIDTNDTRKCTITGCIRGLGGTQPRKWGFDEDTNRGTESKATVTQLLMITSPQGFTAGLMPLYMDQLVGGIIMSTNDPGQQGGLYHDFLYGYGMGLALPARYVDYEGMERIALMTGGLQMNRFWVDEGGKGKDSLMETLKLAGMYLVTKRFTRSGTSYFGLSLDTITVPAYTTYNDTLTDAERRSGSSVRRDDNSRILINSVMVKPFGPYSWGRKESDGEPIYEWDEWSIQEFGPSKTLEFKPTAMFQTFDDQTSGRTFFGREAQVAQLTASGTRWFGAFGRGNYTLNIECAAPVGYRYQSGDRVLISFTGVRNPQGTVGIVGSVGKITNIEHFYGSRAKTTITVRLAYEDVSELAPCAQVSAIGASTFTVVANVFSKPAQFIPFTQTTGATDADWFDPAKYGGNVRCEVWTEGKYATTVQTFQVTSRTGNTLTVDTNLTAASVATNLGAGEKTYMSFRIYSSTLGTTLQRQYAHAASNAIPSLLDSAHTPKEYR